MPNIPKPELERGNFICYADKPDTIVDNSGGGGGDEGGGVAFDEYQIAVHLYCGEDESFEDIEPFKDKCIKYNGEYLTGFTMNSDVGAFEKIINVKALDVLMGVSSGEPGLGIVDISGDYYDWAMNVCTYSADASQACLILSTKQWVNAFIIESEIPWVEFIVNTAVL